jgi:hypothetical protein
MPHDDELHESPLSPADDERIRRLLRDARHTEAIPDAVAARLDGVLHDLVADRAERDAAQPGPARRGSAVVDLAARRRRTAANLLIAAAAVVAVGVGISQVLPQGNGDGEAAMEGTADEAAPGDGSNAGGAGEEPAPVAPAESTAAKVRSQRFGADVRKIQVQVARGFLDEGVTEHSAGQGCLTADPGPGTEVPATYDGARAVVVLRLPSGDVQVVDLYLCGDTEPRRSITLTVP